MNKNNNPPVKQSISREMFFELSDKISDNPLTRVPRSTRSTVKSILEGTNDKNIFVDVHMHAFNQKNIPDDFALTSFGLPKGLVDLAASIFLKKTYFLSNSTPKKILEELLSNYNSVLSNQVERPEIFLTLLMMDMEQGITGSVKENYQTQLKSVLKLKKEFQYKYPLHHDTFKGSHHLLPFLAIDPNNRDAYKLFLSAFSKKINFTPNTELDDESPFVGVKVYPSLGYLPYHPTLMDIFEICEKKKIPVTAHCGGTRTQSTFKSLVLPRRKYDNVTGNFEDIWDAEETNIRVAGITRYKEIFLFPDIWREVLYAYPNLKLNIAHLGSNEEWEGAENTGSWNSLKQSFKLLKEFKNVYGDFSYSFYKKENLNFLFNKIKDDDVLKSKIMYGSDYYLNEVEKGSTRDHLMNLLSLIPENLKSNLFFKNSINFIFG